MTSPTTPEGETQTLQDEDEIEYRAPMTEERFLAIKACTTFASVMGNSPGANWARQMNVQAELVCEVERLRAKLDEYEREIAGLWDNVAELAAHHAIEHRVCLYRVNT
jgi:hypothetical protein